MAPSLIALSGTLLFVLGAWIEPNAWWGAVLGFGGLEIAFGALVYAVGRPKLLTAIKIDRQFVWLDKVSPEYLQEFTELMGS